MKHLARQRIRYLVEFGGVYPHDEPASKNFVLKWLAIACTLHFLGVYLLLR